MFLRRVPFLSRPPSLSLFLIVICGKLLVSYLHCCFFFRTLSYFVSVCLCAYNNALLTFPFFPPVASVLLCHTTVCRFLCPLGLHACFLSLFSLMSFVFPAFVASSLLHSLLSYTLLFLLLSSSFSSNVLQMNL